MEMTQTMPVVRIEAAQTEAYESGYDKFNDVPVDDPENFDLSGFRDGAEYANHVLPSLRALAGHGDSGHGTYTQDRDVAILEPHQDEDLPAEADVVTASELLDELLNMWRRGVYDAVEGEEKFTSLDWK